MCYFFDLDGTITTRGGISLIWFPSFLIWLVLKIYKPKIKKNTRDLISELSLNGEKIVICTARPDGARVVKETKKYLNYNNVNYTRIYFLGTGPFVHKKKVAIAIAENAVIIFDNSKRVMKEAKKKKIKAQRI